MTGGAGGDVDEVAAHRGAAGFGAGEAGQRPAARSRLCAMAAHASQAAFAGKRPDGRWATGPSVRSANTCSTWAWPQCVPRPGSSRRASRVNTACSARREQIFDPADDQPGGDGLAFLRGECGVGHLGGLRRA
jgi:hypothetical protein